MRIDRHSKMCVVRARQATEGILRYAAKLGDVEVGTPSRHPTLDV
jgi:hypothetical protein